MLRAAHTTCRTDTGRQRRGNEDSAFARAPLFVVADGMGGAQAGEVASKIAVDELVTDAGARTLLHAMAVGVVMTAAPSTAPAWTS